MAICNLFKKLTNENGTFFSFSQYADDLTIHQSNNSYKVIPSKFICFDVDYANFDNETLPLLLQNNFENGYAFLKNDPEFSEWTPKTTADLFWSSTQELFNFNGIFNSVYVGDINIQSYSSKDNIGYNEIYCYIPNDAKKTIIENPFNNYELTINKEYNDNYILGYDNNDAINFEGLLPLDKVISNNQLINIHSFIYTVNKTLNLDNLKELNDKSFSFNTIVILYDICVDNNIIYQNIPMGMYVTGLINDGVMENSVKKFVSNDDIYSAGTSYGLRICNRLIVSPNGTSIKTDINSLTDEDRIYESLTQVMSSMVESQSKMDNVVDSIYNYHNNIKDHLAIIKNNRINVPYIKYVNSEPYWFVNGKSTGYTAAGVVGLKYDKNNDSIVEGTDINVGKINSADGLRSHAEGVNTEASGNYSHAEGMNNISNGIAAHTEGSSNIAYGDYSHVSGVGNIANNEAQFVVGQYATVDDTGNKIFQVGIGTNNDNRIDAFAINKDGTIEFEGDVIETNTIDDDLTPATMSLRRNSSASTYNTPSKVRKKVVLDVNDLDNLVNMNEIISTSVNDYYEGKQVPDFSNKLDILTEVSESNTEKLEALQQNIFDPDGNLTHDFINTMMAQVGADSMNFHMAYTKTGLNNDGQEVLYNILLENNRFYVKEKDILSHFVYNSGPQKGTWNITGNFNTYLEPNKTYYLCLKCNRNDNNGIWVCSERQYKTEEDPNYWYFNWGILLYIDETYKLIETRGCSYMYGDNLVCGKISSIGGNSYFDLNNGDFILGDVYGNPALKFTDGVLTIGGVNDDSVDSLMSKLGIIDDKIYLNEVNINDVYNETQRIEEEYKDAIAMEELARTQAVAELGIIQDSLQKQIDGEISSYFYDIAPIDNDGNILTNIAPFNEWVENYNLIDGIYVLKDGTRNEFVNHIGDTYTNMQEYVSDTDTPFAGLSWRWCDATTVNPLPDKYIIINYKDENGNDVTKKLHWHKIADSDAIKALQEAGKAQATADNKSTTFVRQPSNYKEGDLWILQSNTDHIAGKKGEILTANKSNNIYDAADWSKEVTYTDDTALLNMEIGGRNLLTGSELLQINHKILKNDLNNNANYTISCSEIIKGSNCEYIRVAIQIPDGGYKRLVNEWDGSPITFNTEGGYTIIHLFGGNVNDNTQISTFKFLKLEKGIKATDWTPAPEDVELEIQDAKSDAVNAQMIANAAAEKLETWSADGVITHFEVQGIKDELASIKADYDEINTDYVKYGLDNPTNFNEKYNVYKNYLDEFSFATANEPVKIPDDFAQVQKNYYDARTEAYNNISNAVTDYADSVAREQAQNALDGLIVGGTNLIPAVGFSSSDNNQTITTLTETLYDQIIYQVTKKTSATPPASVYNITDYVTAGKTYVASVYIRCDTAPSGTNICKWGRIILYGKNTSGANTTYAASDIEVEPIVGQWYQRQVVYTIPSDFDFEKQTINIFCYAPSDTGVESSMSCIKLEEGNKATPTYNMPISSIAQWAEESIQQLNDMSNDSILTPQEKKNVSNEWSEIQGMYDVNSNNVTLLFGDSKPTEWTEYNTKYNNLSAYITLLNLGSGSNTDITKTTFQTKFSEYYNADVNLQKAIAKKSAELEMLSMEIGGRNLFLNSAVKKWSNWAMKTNPTVGIDDTVCNVTSNSAENLYLYIPFSTTNINSHLQTSTLNWKDRNVLVSVEVLSPIDIELNLGLVFRIEKSGDSSYTNIDGSYYSGKYNTVKANTWTQIYGVDNFVHNYEETITIDGVQYPTDKVDKYLVIGSKTAISSGDTFKFKNFKLEFGTKPTAWTPAPEDVDAKITEVSELSAEAKAAAARAETSAQALNYLKTTMTAGTTDIAGGLVLTNVMALKDLNGNVTAGLSGLDEDNVLLWGGANYQDAVVAADHDYKKENGELITSLIKKDGTGKIGVFEVDNDSAVVNDFTGDERVVISNKKINEQDSVLDISSRRYILNDAQKKTVGTINSDKYYSFNFPHDSIEDENWENNGILSYMTGKLDIESFKLDSEVESANVSFYISIYNASKYDYILLQTVSLIKSSDNKLSYDINDPNASSGVVYLNFKIDLSNYNILREDLDSRIKYAFKLNVAGKNLEFYELQTCNTLFCCSTKKIQICSDGMRILTDNGCQTVFSNQFGYNKIIIKNLPGYTLNQNELTYDEYLKYQLYCSKNSTAADAFTYLKNSAGNLNVLLLQFRDFFIYFNELIGCLKEEDLSTNTNTILTKLENCLKAGGKYTGNDTVERYGILTERSESLNPSDDDYLLPLDDLIDTRSGRYTRTILTDLKKSSASAADKFDSVKTIHIK